MADGDNIEIGTGELIAAEVEALVNPVNCAGVMGKGISFGFKRRFPAAFTAYAKACKAGEVKPGSIFAFEAGERLILHFPVKKDFRDVSTLEDIDAGLVALVAEIAARDLRSIAIPALGCELEELAWSDVEPRIRAALGPLTGVRVLLYGPTPSEA